MVLTCGSMSDKRTEPVSATPKGDRTVLTSILLASDQWPSSAGRIVPLHSGTAEQIVLAFGNLLRTKLSRSGSVCDDDSGHFHHALPKRLNSVIGLIDSKVRNMRHMLGSRLIFANCVNDGIPYLIAAHIPSTSFPLSR